MVVATKFSRRWAGYSSRYGDLMGPAGGTSQIARDCRGQGPCTFLSLAECWNYIISPNFSNIIRLTKESARHVSPFLEVLFSASYITSAIPDSLRCFALLSLPCYMVWSF